ncbi:hypothetical protein PAHAL_9G109900 [Panicum hallii]|uniref:Uncharacterized protein n=1 Tax=Panicum hallii TaxID=206008 RepID=A0A2S3IIL8_9POAL|nr:hypothetical protein PAHAL_9G109900 [Panicum hallii]
MCTRGHWRPSEDEKLKELVALYGPHNWNAIAEKLQGRSGKSCRLRWFNQLDPRINRSPFSEEEEELLLASHRVHGNRERMRMSNRRGAGAPGAATGGAAEDENNPRNAKKPRTDSSGMASLLDKYRREFAVPFAINNDSNKEDYCSTTNEEDTNKSVEFYDFLQVNANSSDTKCGSSIEEQEENRDDQAEGQVQFIDFLEVGAASHRQ